MSRLFPPEPDRPSVLAAKMLMRDRQTIYYVFYKETCVGTITVLPEYDPSGRLFQRWILHRTFLFTAPPHAIADIENERYTVKYVAKLFNHQYLSPSGLLDTIHNAEFFDSKKKVKHRLWRIRQSRYARTDEVLFLE
jgi:hypothetical protein